MGDNKSVHRTSGTLMKALMTPFCSLPPGTCRMWRQTCRSDKIVCVYVSADKKTATTYIKKERLSILKAILCLSLICLFPLMFTIVSEEGTLFSLSMTPYCYFAVAVRNGQVLPSIAASEDVLLCY